MNNKITTTANFSKYAACYDDYSDVQKTVGEELISTLKGQHFKRILDIGCGTGTYTLLLRQTFPNASITAVDICEEMIHKAMSKLNDCKIKFVTADAETMSLNESCDLITSNACFQWLENFQSDMANYNNLLAEDGTILFSMFGPSTFHQLSKSLAQFYRQDIHIASQSFIDRDTLTAVLANSFNCVSITEQTFDKRYDSLLHLLKTIKYTGTKGAGLNGRVLTRNALAEIEKIYIQRFGDIIATYQVFYCRAKRKDKQ